MPRQERPQEKPIRRNLAEPPVSLTWRANPASLIFTVSAVVNNKSHVGKNLRERVENAIRKLNYRPNLIARSLIKQKTQTIGMIVPDIANPFFPDGGSRRGRCRTKTGLQSAALQQR